MLYKKRRIDNFSSPIKQNASKKPSTETKTNHQTQKKLINEKTLTNNKNKHEANLKLEEIKLEEQNLIFKNNLTNKKKLENTVAKQTAIKTKIKQIKFNLERLKLQQESNFLEINSDLSLFESTQTSLSDKTQSDLYHINSLIQSDIESSKQEFTNQMNESTQQINDQTYMNFIPKSGSTGHLEINPHMINEEKISTNVLIINSNSLNTRKIL